MFLRQRSQVRARYGPNWEEVVLPKQTGLRPLQWFLVTRIYSCTQFSAGVTVK